MRTWLKITLTTIVALFAIRLAVGLIQPFLPSAASEPTPSFTPHPTKTTAPTRTPSPTKTPTATTSPYSEYFGLWNLTVAQPEYYPIPASFEIFADPENVNHMTIIVKGLHLGGDPSNRQYVAVVSTYLITPDQISTNNGIHLVFSGYYRRQVYLSIRDGSLRAYYPREIWWGDDLTLFYFRK